MSNIDGYMEWLASIYAYWRRMDRYREMCHVTATALGTVTATATTTAFGRWSWLMADDRCPRADGRCQTHSLIDHLLQYPISSQHSNIHYIDIQRQLPRNIQSSHNPQKYHPNITQQTVIYIILMSHLIWFVYHMIHNHHMIQSLQNSRHKNINMYHN